ncbi:unnamed protein product, partial [Polarella glacialis]
MGESELQRARRLAALGKAKASSSSSSSSSSEKKKKAKKKEKKSSSSSKKPKAPSSSDSEDNGPKEAKEAGEAKEAKEANEAKAAGERAAAEKLEELRSEGRVGPKVTADVAVGAALELQEAKRSAEEKSKQEKEEEKEEKQQEKKEEKEEEKKKDKKEDKKESKKSDKKGKKEDKEKAKKDKKSADKEEKQAKKDEERKQLEKKEKKKEEKEAKRARDLVTLEALRAKTRGASGKPGEGKATNVDAFSFDPTAKRHAPTHEKLSDSEMLAAGINPWNMAKLPPLLTKELLAAVLLGNIIALLPAEDGFGEQAHAIFSGGVGNLAKFEVVPDQFHESAKWEKQQDDKFLANSGQPGPDAEVIPTSPTASATADDNDLQWFKIPTWLRNDIETRLLIGKSRLSMSNDFQNKGRLDNNTLADHLWQCSLQISQRWAGSPSDEVLKQAEAAQNKLRLCQHDALQETSSCRRQNKRAERKYKELWQQVGQMQKNMQRLTSELKDDLLETPTFVRLKFLGEGVKGGKPAPMRGSLRDVKVRNLEDLAARVEDWLGAPGSWQLSTVANWPLTMDAIRRPSSSRCPLVVNVRNSQDIVLQRLQELSSKQQDLEVKFAQEREEREKEVRASRERVESIQEHLLELNTLTDVNQKVQASRRGNGSRSWRERCRNCLCQLPLSLILGACIIVALLIYNIHQVLFIDNQLVRQSDLVHTLLFHVDHEMQVDEDKLDNHINDMHDSLHDFKANLANQKASLDFAFKQLTDLSNAFKDLHSDVEKHSDHEEARNEKVKALGRAQQDNFTKFLDGQHHDSEKLKEDLQGE